MPGRLAVDFGTSNTVIAVWDEDRQEGVPFHLADYGKRISYRRGADGEEQISVIPSLIHYAVDQRRWVGRQVVRNGLYESERTFRWMKRYIGRRSPLSLRVEGRTISHFEAGRDFLVAVLGAVAAEVGLQDEEVALTVPVEAFEHYEDWLTGVAEAAGLGRLRLIDEPSAAALGYGLPIQPGDVYLVFDFGGGTLDVSVVLIDEATAQAKGQRCRVLGKAGTEVGGATIDQWLFQEVLRQNQRGESDEEIRKISLKLLVACERTKEQLSFSEEAEIRVQLGERETLNATFTQKQLEDLLDQHEVFSRIDQTLRRALNAARERGYDQGNVKNVLLVGGSSLMPPVQRFLQRLFGREKVMLRRPLDAVARGAAAFVAGVDIFDHIQHDYAVRHVNTKTGAYDYRSIVKRGTPYPTARPVARLAVKASHDGQEQLGLAIFEMGERNDHGSRDQLELVFDPTGAARLSQAQPDDEERRSLFWINENSPTFLKAQPPAKQGEARFEVEFGIDANKRLLITARDLTTRQVTHRDHPVVRLA